ncbi:hypothetical protein KEM52_006169 [Ascosphaera acerosa]|nr:hypothetical protein KEM52_006169 [Ascosphaera acerosa]
MTSLIPLRSLGGVPKTVSTLRATYNPANVYGSIAARYVQLPFHPLRPKILHAYAARAKGVLWWSVSQGELTPEKRRTRSVFMRKTRQAVVDALAERGYDGSGRKKSSQAASDEDEDGPGGDLVAAGPAVIAGTLEIHPRKAILAASQERIKQDAGAIVDAVIAQREQGGDRNRRARASAKPRQKTRKPRTPPTTQA